MQGIALASNLRRSSAGTLAKAITPTLVINEYHLILPPVNLLLDITWYSPRYWMMFTGRLLENPFVGSINWYWDLFQWYVIHVLNPWGVSFDTDMFLGQMYAIRGEYRTILTCFWGYIYIDPWAVSNNTDAVWSINPYWLYFWSVHSSNKCYLLK
jgi:hypothetical protein